MVVLKLGGGFVPFSQTYGVGVPHRAATIRGETVAVEINDIDAQGAKGKTFFENARALFDECIEATTHDFLRADLAWRNTCLCNPSCNETSHLRVRSWPALFIVSVPAGTGFLPIPAELAEFVFAERLAHPALLEMTIFLADAPANIETRKAPSPDRTHRHTVLAQRIVHGLDAPTLFHEELRFAAIGTEHPVANKSRTVADG